jgi:hypothetical protein
MFEETNNPSQLEYVEILYVAQALSYVYHNTFFLLWLIRLPLFLLFLCMQ